MTKRAAGILYSMVLLVASSAYDIVSAEIETDSAGNYSFSGIESYPQG
jgi:hypothetical protein